MLQGAFAYPITLKTQTSPESPWYLGLGKNSILFGLGEGELAYKPLRMRGGMRERTLIASYQRDYYARFSLFHLRAMNTFIASPTYYNANIGFHRMNRTISYDIGTSYLYSIMESPIFQNSSLARSSKGSTWMTNRHIPAYTSYANFRYKKLNTYVSYLSATGTMDKSKVRPQQSDAIPKAIRFLSSYDIKIREMPCTLIGFYDHSYQAFIVHLPERRVGFGLNIHPTRRTSVQLQYSRDFNYKTDTSKLIIKNKPVMDNPYITNLIAVQFSVMLV